jgi:hypothetical protein
MVGDFEPENLSCPEEEDDFGAGCVDGESLFEEPSDQMPKGTKTAQNRCGQPPGQRAVAVSKRCKARMGAFAGEQFVEGDATP